MIRVSLGSFLVGCLSVPFCAAMEGQGPAIAQSTLSPSERGSGVASILTITGQGFGTKPQAKPYFHQPFRDTPEGAGIHEAGFDVSGGNNARPKYNVISMADGVGGGCVLHRAPCLSDHSVGGESFHHLGKMLPPETDEVFASCWVKLTRLSEPTENGLIQIKGMRMSIAAGAPDGIAMYYNKPKYAFSVFLDQRLKVRGNHSYWWASEDQNEHRDDSFKASATHWNYDDVWVSWEVYYRLNDIGAANGIQEMHLGGKKAAFTTTAKVRSKPSEHLEYVQFSPGITNGTQGADWEFRISHCYVDTSRARIFLGNAPRIEACNGRFPIAATTWSDDVIAAELGPRPDGYDWIYVITADGQGSQHGFALPPSP